MDYIEGWKDGVFFFCNSNTCKIRLINGHIVMHLEPPLTFSVMASCESLRNFKILIISPNDFWWQKIYEKNFFHMPKSSGWNLQCKILFQSSLAVMSRGTFTGIIFLWCQSHRNIIHTLSPMTKCGNKYLLFFSRLKYSVRLTINGALWESLKLY